MGQHQNVWLIFGAPCAVAEIPVIPGLTRNLHDMDFKAMRITVNANEA